MTAGVVNALSPDVVDVPFAEDITAKWYVVAGESPESTILWNVRRVELVVVAP